MLKSIRILRKYSGGYFHCMDLTRTPLLTTKITKDTKVSEILSLNFVLFVSFVVQTVFAYLVAE